MKKPLALDIYNNKNFVREYELRNGNITDPAFYERLPTLSLLPAVYNKKVLDAGCGPGVYSAWLINQGAVVTAIDYSNEMLKLVRQKFGDKIELHNADLNQPLNFSENDEFDLILCTMVLLHIEDWASIFNEFNRILKPGGSLIFSTVHPFADYLEYGGNYFATELVEEEWPEYKIIMPGYRRSLSSIFAVMKKSGFVCDELIEPVPVKVNGEEISYASFDGQPWFICIRAKK